MTNTMNGTPDDSYCVVQFLDDASKTYVVPSAYVYEEEKSQSCHLTDIEIENVMSMGDISDEDWKQKLVVEVFPEERHGVAHKCKEKHSALNKNGCSGLDLGVDVDGIESTPKRPRTCTTPCGHSDKSAKKVLLPSSVEKPPVTAAKHSGMAKSKHLKGLSTVVSQHAPTEASKDMESPNPVLLSKENIPLAPHSDITEISDSNDAFDLLDESSVDSISINESGLHEEIMENPNKENQGSKLSENLASNKLGESENESVPTTNFMSESMIKRLFCWMHKTNITLRNIQESQKEILELLQSKNVKTACTVIPDLELPCCDPGQIQCLEERLSDKQVFSDFVKYLIFKAKGNTALHIGYKLMSLIMTPYCGGFYTWDGIHKSGKKLSIKSHAKLHKAIEDAMASMTVKNDAGKVTVTSDDIKKKAGRWLTTSETRLKNGEPRPSLPWSPRVSDT